MPLPLALVGVAAQGINALMQVHNKNKAKNKLKTKRDKLAALERGRQDIENPYAHLSNPYANLSVATQAAEIANAETDLSLANTLDTLASSGQGAGAATLLAQEASQSKMKISAGIEKQEAANEKLRAEGQKYLDEKKAGGKDLVWQREEARDLAQLDRAQAEIDEARMDNLQAKQNMVGSLTGMSEGLFGLGMEQIAAGTTPNGNKTLPGFDESTQKTLEGALWAAVNP